MKKTQKIVILFLSVMMIIGSTLTVYADDNDSSRNSGEDNHSLQIPASSYSIGELTDELSNNPLAEDENCSAPIITRTRSAALLADNPNTRVSGSLTTSDTQALYFFSITGTSRFMLARLLSANANYVAQLFVYDESTGTASATNYYGFSGNLITLNGLPVGDYVFAVYSYDSTYGDSYTFDINATNPAANISSVKYIAADLSIFIFETTSGDVYGNGSFIYNTSTTINSNLEWQRISENNWGSGYEQRTMDVYNVHVSSMSGPVSYSSNYASSNCAVLIYCDTGTGFSYFHSYYQSGNPPVYDSSWEDTTGRTTPRTLDAADFAGGNQHILVFDLITGQCIDFYSTLNIFYAAGYEPAPTINFY